MKRKVLATAVAAGLAAGCMPSISRDQGVQPRAPSSTTIERGIAPFDSASAADRLILEVALSDMRRKALSACRHAVELVDETPLPSRDELQGLFNAEFPDVPHIEQAGFRLTPVGEVSQSPSKPSDKPCPLPAEIGKAIQLWDGMHRAWQVVLSEIESMAEVAEARADFTDCLQEHGVPPPAALNEVAFLSHVDRLQLEAANDPRRVVQLGQDLGGLYTHCGRELFDLRETLRGGEHRSRFLKIHSDDLTALATTLAKHTSILRRWETSNRL